MHHSLGLYGRHQHGLLRLYLNLTSLVRIPLLGRLVRWAANTYGRLGHSGYYLTLAEAEQIVDIAGSVALGPCSCRAEYHNCEYPIMSEIVLSSGSSEVYAGKEKEFRKISREEAKTILRQAHQKRLTQSIMRCGKHFYAICSCCNCCCIPTRLRQNYGIGMALVRNNNIVADFQGQQLD
jgi:hypothetical protein